jgi:hypothetical protein
VTILGRHTVAEVKELIDNKDFEISQVMKLHNEFVQQWANVDQREDWEKDWKIFYDRYRNARLKAKTAITAAMLANAAVGPSIIPAEESWQEILRAGSDTYPLYGKGDWPDLTTRIQAASGRKLDMTKRPGYVVSDIDLIGYKASDTAIKKGEEAAKSDTAMYVYAGLGIAGAAGLLYLAKH